MEAFSGVCVRTVLLQVYNLLKVHSVILAVSRLRPRLYPCVSNIYTLIFIHSHGWKNWPTSWPEVILNRRLTCFSGIYAWLRPIFLQRTEGSCFERGWAGLWLFLLFVMAKRSRSRTEFHIMGMDLFYLVPLSKLGRTSRSVLWLWGNAPESDVFITVLGQEGAFVFLFFDSVSGGQHAVPVLGVSHLEVWFS